MTQTLVLPPLTLVQKVMRLVWSGALSFAVAGFIYGIYFLVTAANYSFPWLGLKGPYTLSNMWNTWPQSANLPQTLAFIPLGGEGGLGTWFVGQWPDIQKVLLQGWPISVLAAAFVALALNKGATVKIGWFDKLLLRLHDVFGVIPSRLQSEPTTGPQYLFVLPLALLFALPGAILFFGLDFGLIALLHHNGYNGFAVANVLNAAWFQIVGAGFLSHQFFANKVTMKPAADFTEFFEDRALGKANAGIAALKDYRDGGCDVLTALERATASGRKVAVPWWYPPNYVRALNARLTLLEKGQLQFRERTGSAKIIMVITVGIFILVAIAGLYSKFWLANHGGLFL
jgi:hypothetical protein